MQTYTATEFTACNKGGLFTQSQLETLAWMAEGKENSVIGLLRGHGEPGAKKLTSQVMHKLQCNNRCLAIARAFASGYLVPKSSIVRAIAVFLIAISGFAASAGSGDQFLRTTNRTRTARTRYEQVVPGNQGSAV